MAKKARQRISYVLELDHSSSGGHRLGVNGLAVDRDNAILYSGGRDGVVCAWDLDLNLNGRSSSPPKPIPTTTFRASTQAHTHWINDIALVSQNTALVSASSDLTVKLWRRSSGNNEAHTIGQHADYVKCLATPSTGDWVASGGLDRKIYLWDLNGKGKSLEIDMKSEAAEKGSVYALGVGRSILASGGPESIVRLWDPKTGKRVTKFVGHTSNIRSILVNEAGDTVLTASSDQTIKVWSVTAGRCMYTFTMHNDSVWSLFSDDPELGVFYSSDRSGLIVKTDTRNTVEMDEGLSVAVAQEHDGINKVVACGNYIWTATSSSSINRWTGVDTGPDAQLPEPFMRMRSGSTTSRPRQASVTSVNETSKNEIPANSILKMSHTASFPPGLGLRDTSESNLAAPSISRKGSEIVPGPVPAIEPIHHLPEETIEGQNGLVKHKLLNDRRRVLTLDTAGDVLLWDLIRCEVIQRFGKRHLEDVEPTVNTREAVAPWCSIDTSSGNLTVVLEPFNCFDAEMYADELKLEEPVEFREDQRINLGRWILRYLFARLIDEEIKRDEVYRKKLNEGIEKRLATTRLNPPASLVMPAINTQGWSGTGSPVTTPKANGSSLVTSPGLGIGVATPAVHLPGVPEKVDTPSSSVEKRSMHASRQSSEDYFSSGISSADAPYKVVTTPATVEPPTAEASKPPVETKEKEKDGPKSPSTPFGKKFKMTMSFGSKKTGRSASSNTEKPVVVEEKPEENKSESSSNHEKEVDDSFRGVIQKIHNDYERQILESPDQSVETKITPSLPNETPVLKLPPGTKIIIQEEASGGSADLYRGTVMTVGADADIIEEKAPMWLGEVLLMNTIPPKDPVKVSFILHPWQDSLPSIAAADGNNRLNANRMLRVKKILAYVAERIETPPEEPDPNALKPEEYLELYCNDRLLQNTMSLATLRAHIWKGGNDVVLYYKANGRKEIPKVLPKGEAPAEAEVAPVLTQPGTANPTT